MLTLKNLESINIETSSKCTARCPFCSRMKKKRAYGGHFISLSDFQKLPRNLFKQLKRISFAGNFGDFSTNPELVYMAQYLKSLNSSIIMGGDTNGMVQDASWWRDLGACFLDGGTLFAVDGLADTHSLHRIGTDFNTVLKNMQAFIQGGGAAYWKFIVFEHNEHQVHAAESMAKDIGCAGFLAVSSREYNDTLRKPQTYHFEMKHDIFSRFAEDAPETRCNPVSKGTIYIAADGTVHPCCLAHCMYITEHADDFQFVVPLIDQYKSEINFKTKPLEEIISGPFFKKIVAKAKQNTYCRMKCNRFKREIRKQLVLYKNKFNPDLEIPL